MYTAAKWPQTTGVGGHNFHGNDFAAPRQADVGRGWLTAAWFLLQSLILKLSLTQQIPFSSPASPFTSFLRTRLPFIFWYKAPPPPPPPLTLLYPSICLPEGGENKTNTAWKKAISKINPRICFDECHHDSDLSPVKNICALKPNRKMPAYVMRWKKESGKTAMMYNEKKDKLL